MIVQYTIVSASALAWFEWSIIFFQECNVIWARKWSLVTCFYACARFSSLLVVVPASASLLSSMGCSIGAITGYVIIATQEVIISVFSASRVFTLSYGNTWLAGLVFLLKVLPLFANILFTLHNNCVIRVDNEMSVSMASCIAAVLADLTVLAITWHCTFATYIEARRVGIKTPLIRCMLRDGTIHFFVVGGIHGTMLASSISDNSQASATAFMELVGESLQTKANSVVNLDSSEELDLFLNNT
ncbi:hypothetical protein BC629DRAFT_1445017 [Irpex lacteus]|nr:hypothetical protein BC629DRAFT_1445017 [Irpex lacteus]